MARRLTEWPSKRGPIPKIMPSDGCKGDTVPLAVGRLYNFHKFGCHLGNVGLYNPGEDQMIGYAEQRCFLIARPREARIDDYSALARMTARRIIKCPPVPRTG